MACEKQIAFRGALLNCKDKMGKETWRSFCFLYGVSERVREKGRSAVLDHLVTTGAVSGEKSAEFAERLRKDLGHANLAQTFLEALSEEKAVTVEKREKANRIQYSADRRRGRRFSDTLCEDDIAELSLEGSAQGEEEDAALGLPGDAVLVRRPRETDGAATPTHDTYDQFCQMPRNVSGFSIYSDRSSGYFSWRSSSITSRGSLMSIQFPGPEEDGQLQPLEEICSLNRNPSSSSSFSTTSSSMEDEFQSCSSGSLESLSTTGSLPRGATAVSTRGELDYFATRDDREGSPQVVDSPTHSTVQKTDTISLRHKDIMADIDQRLTDKVYRSLNSGLHGIDFELCFHPTNHEGSSAALNVYVSNHIEKGVIPPLDITVSVYDTPLEQDGKRVCLASDKRSSKGSVIFQGNYTALFPKLIDHETLCRATGEHIVIQVIMEYSITHSPRVAE